VMPGAAPTALIGEQLGVAGWLGIVLVVAGVLFLSLRGGRALPTLDRRAVGFALFTAVTVCAYSVVDGIGARQAGSANAYSVALFVGIGPVMALYALARRGRKAVTAAAGLSGPRPLGGALPVCASALAVSARAVP